MIFFLLQMSDVEVMSFCLLMTNITFFLLNITKTWRTDAPKKPYDSLKSHFYSTHWNRTKIAACNMYKLDQQVAHLITRIKFVSDEKLRV